MPAEFAITKQIEYGWRCNARFGSAAHGHFTTWNVMHGSRLLRGGSIEGNNTRSCVAYFTRRKDAAAWLAGLLGEAPHAGADAEERSAYRDGVASRVEFVDLLGNT